jgi:predicted DNA-binding mobile mystery protein A
MVITSMKAEMRSILLQALDKRLPQLRVGMAAEKPAHGWLRAIRTAVGVTQQQVASKLGVTRASYVDLENAEQRGAITLNSLERAAAAMDCSIVYFVVPNAAVAADYSALADRLDPKRRQLRAAEHSMALEDQAVGDLPPRR